MKSNSMTTGQMFLIIFSLCLVAAVIILAIILSQKVNDNDDLHDQLDTQTSCCINKTQNLQKCQNDSADLEQSVATCLSVNNSCKVGRVNNTCKTALLHVAKEVGDELGITVSLLGTGSGSSTAQTNVLYIVKHTKDGQKPGTSPKFAATAHRAANALISIELTYSPTKPVSMDDRTKFIRLFDARAGPGAPNPIKEGYTVGRGPLPPPSTAPPTPANVPLGGRCVKTAAVVNSPSWVIGNCGQQFGNGKNPVICGAISNKDDNCYMYDPLPYGLSSTRCIQTGPTDVYPGCKGNCDDDPTCYPDEDGNPGRGPWCNPRQEHEQICNPPYDPPLPPFPPHPTPGGKGDACHAGVENSCKPGLVCKTTDGKNKGGKGTCELPGPPPPPHVGTKCIIGGPNICGDLVCKGASDHKGSEGTCQHATGFDPSLKPPHPHPSDHGVGTTCPIGGENVCNHGLVCKAAPGTKHIKGGEGKCQHATGFDPSLKPPHPHPTPGGKGVGTTCTIGGENVCNPDLVCKATPGTKHQLGGQGKCQHATGFDPSLKPPHPHPTPGGKGVGTTCTIGGENVCNPDLVCKATPGTKHQLGGQGKCQHATGFDPLPKPPPGPKKAYDIPYNPADVRDIMMVEPNTKESYSCGLKPFSSRRR